MMHQARFIHIVSGDHVFNELMASMLRHFSTDSEIRKIHSFNELRQDERLERCDLLLLGDMLVGARGMEVLEYVRRTRQLRCLIGYFCDPVPEMREKALRRGANVCYTKPLKPDLVVLDLLERFRNAF